MQTENQRKRKETQIFKPCQRTEKTMEHESEGNANCNWCAWKIPKGFLRGRGELEIRGRTETIQATALLRSARILRRVQET